jgi:hypothetical protein
VSGELMHQCLGCGKALSVENVCNICAFRALRQIVLLREVAHAQQEAIEWLVRDGADQDDCAKAREFSDRARKLLDGG